MKFGFHISIAGGFDKILERARQRQCETIQLFSRNPRGWDYTPLVKSEVEKFREDIKKNNIEPVVVHMPYLPNLATSDKLLFSKSYSSLTTELERAFTLGAKYLVMHVGKSKGDKIPTAIKSLSTAVNNSLEEVQNNVILLLENTAGQGSEIGTKLEEIAEILENIEQKNRTGICLDTAHIFEAGYNISTKQGLDNFLQDFDKIIGLGKLHLIHLNDSKSKLGSNVDRHWHIGEGEIGLEAMRNIINHKKLQHLPAIMETPKKKELEDDLHNIATVKKLKKS